MLLARVRYTLLAIVSVAIAWPLAIAVPCVQADWYVPALRNFVASEYKERASDLKIKAFERHELTSFSVRGAEHLAQR